ncbi:MAG: hypothetical protein OES38_00870 [Gammaproteobacteria bacterium]|nr:hypothetical protein [Gammaproteobacteria bacterium]
MIDRRETSDVEIEIRSDLNLAIIRPTGPFSIETARNWAGHLIVTPGFQRGMHQIFDLSDVNFAGVAPDEISEAVGVVQRRNSKGTGLIAYVAPEDLHYGLARMFTAAAEYHLPRVRGVFRSLKEATDWIVATDQE